MSHAALSAVLAVASTVAVLVIFDWDASEVAVWGGIGAVVWTVVAFFTWTAAMLPRGDLLPPPPDVVLGRRGGLIQDAIRLVAVVMACVGIAWLATEMDAGAFSIPGQFIGYACASLAGALWVAWWERRHGQTVVARYEREDDDELYATPLAPDADG